MIKPIARWDIQFLVAPAKRARTDSAPMVSALLPTTSEDLGASGRFVMAWAQTNADPAGRGDTFGIAGQIFDADGAEDGGPFLISSTVSDQQFAPAIVEHALGWLGRCRRTAASFLTELEVAALAKVATPHLANRGS